MLDALEGLCEAPEETARPASKERGRQHEAASMRYFHRSFRVGDSAVWVVAVGERPWVARRVGGGAVRLHAARDIIVTRCVGSGRRVTDRRIGRGDRCASVVCAKGRDGRVDRYGIIDTSFNGFALAWCNGPLSSNSCA